MTETGTAQPSATHSEEERITALEAFAFRTGSDLGDIKQTLTQIVGKLEGIDARLDTHDGRFDRMDEQFDRIDERFDRTDARLDTQDARFDRLDTRLDTQDARFDRLDTEIGLVRDDVRKNSASLEDIRGKVAATETCR